VPIRDRGCSDELGQIAQRTHAKGGAVRGHRAFRFGVLDFAAASREAWIAKARKAEALGYATFLVPDHFTRQFAPLIALMAAADATRTLRVGSFVCNNDFRHPAVLAKEVATLDLLSDGRFEFGLGAGWARAEYEQLGLPFERPGVRLRRLAEAVRVIKALLADGPAALAGDHYALAGATGFPQPVQRPHPPILMGGSGRRMLTLAAREADIVSFALQYSSADRGHGEGTTAALARMVAWVRQAAGERFSALELNAFIFDVVVTDNRRQAVAALAEKYGVSPEEVPTQTHALVGSVEQISEQLHMWREHFGLSYVCVVGEEAMEAFAPVVARLAGR
jgi:probable F420-dependent oxidoreductase